MAITVTANLILRKSRFKKEASIIGTLGVAGPLHVAQNAVTRKLLKSPKFHSKLLESLRGSAAGVKGIGAPVSEAGFGSAKAIIPELGVIEKHFGEAGTKFFESLGKKGISLENMPKRSLVVLRKMLKGEFNDARKLAPEQFDLLADSFLSKGFGGAVTGGKQLKLPKENIPEFLNNLEGVWKKNLITNNVLGGVANQMGKVKKLQLPKAKSLLEKQTFSLRDKMRGLFDAGTTAAVAVADPVTAGVNAFKRGLDSKVVSKIPGVKRFVQDPLNKTLVTDPTKNMFNKGFKGETIPFRRPRQLADEFVMNPVVSGIKNLAYDVGRVAGQAQYA